MQTTQMAAQVPVQMHAGTRPPRDSRGGQALRSLRPLAIDIGIPVGSYYLLRDGFGASLWLSLALSSVGPAIRSAWSMARERELNLIAALMLAVNAAGIAVSFLTGDPRAMIAKDSVVSSLIAFAILGSVVARRPLMTAGLKVYLVKGSDERAAAWDRLAVRSARFGRLELLFSGIWGTALLVVRGPASRRLLAAGDDDDVARRRVHPRRDRAGHRGRRRGGGADGADDREGDCRDALA